MSVVDLRNKNKTENGNKADKYQQWFSFIKTQNNEERNRVHSDG